MLYQGHVEIPRIDILFIPKVFQKEPQQLPVVLPQFRDEITKFPVVVHDGIPPSGFPTPSGAARFISTPNTIGQSKLFGRPTLKFGNPLVPSFCRPCLPSGEMSNE